MTARTKSPKPKIIFEIIKENPEAFLLIDEAFSARKVNANTPSVISSLLIGIGVGIMMADGADKDKIKNELLALVDVAYQPRLELVK